jgi:hypothetical protein
VETRIIATPLHNSANFLEVDLPQPRSPEQAVHAVLAAVNPAGFAQGFVPLAVALAADGSDPAPLEEFACRGEGPAADAWLRTVKGKRKARIFVPGQQPQKFTVVLTGKYLLPADQTRVRLELPRPLSVRDRGGSVTTEVDGRHEIVLPEGGLEIAAPDRHRYTQTWGWAPAYADLAWRRFERDVVAGVVADVTVHHHVLHVRQEIQLPRAEGASDKVPAPGGRVYRLAAPHVPVSDLKVVQGGKLLSHPEAKDLQVRGERGESPLVLEYDVALSAGAAGKGGPRGAADAPAFPVPLFRLAEATRVKTKVRFWSEPGQLPVFPEPGPASPWKEVGAEIVKGHDSLPALVLEAEEGKQPGPPLTVYLSNSAVPPVADVVADRVLLQVSVDQDGLRNYRARFYLSKLNTNRLDLELPAPLARLRPVLLLNDKLAPYAEDRAGGKVARVPINPALYAQPVILEVRYQLPAGYPEAEGAFQTALLPPALVGEAVFVGRVRWQVVFPPTHVPLPPGGQTTVEQRPTWRGWLVGPGPRPTDGELARWLTGAPPDDRPPAPGDDARASSGLVFWGSGLEPVTVAHVPWQLWLPVCSGALLLVGLGLLLTVETRLLFWLLLGVLTAGLAAAVLARPALFAAVAYGCEPGAVILVLLVILQWLLQRRYRRQIVFMPAFTRGKPGSSLIRGGSSNPRPRDLSTVDAPPAVLGSIGKSSGSGKEVSP